MLQPKKHNRPDTPLAATPEPYGDFKKSKPSMGSVESYGDLKKSTPKPVNVVRGKINTPKSKKDNNGGYAEGVVISRKDELAHPEDFKYLKK